MTSARCLLYSRRLPKAVEPPRASGKSLFLCAQLLSTVLNPLTLNIGNPEPFTIDSLPLLPDTSDQILTPKNFGKFWRKEKTLPGKTCYFYNGEEDGIATLNDRTYLLAAGKKYIIITPDEETVTITKKADATLTSPPEPYTSSAPDDVVFMSVTDGHSCLTNEKNNNTNESFYGFLMSSLKADKTK